MFLCIKIVHYTFLHDLNNSYSFLFFCRKVRCCLGCFKSIHHTIFLFLFFFIYYKKGQFLLMIFISNHLTINSEHKCLSNIKNSLMWRHILRVDRPTILISQPPQHVSCIVLQKQNREC